jgi:hypothetical protein
MRPLAAVPAALLLSALACAHPRPVVQPPDPQGRTSVRVLNTPARSSVDGEVSAWAPRITPAYASASNALPIYPAHALKARCGKDAVAVRIHVDPAGNVSKQESVPGRPPRPEPCPQAFEAAVAAAVRDWKFAPAFRQTPIVEPGADPRAAPLKWHQEPIAIYLDFEFTFEVVAGRGIVRTQ